MATKASNTRHLMPGEAVALLTGLLACIALIVIVLKPDALGDISALLGIVLVIIVAIPPIVVIARRICARNALTRLTAELEALCIDDSTPLLNLSHFRASLFTGIRGDVFFSLRLHDAGIHWIDLAYFNILNILCQYGFRCHLMVIEFTDDAMPDATRQRCIERLRHAAALFIGKGVRLHLYSRDEIRLTGEELFKSIDLMIGAMRQASDEALDDPASRAAKSILWALFLQSWSKRQARRLRLWRKDKAVPFVLLQFQKTAHRRAHLIDHGCHFIVFPTVSFVAKPRGPVLDVWSPEEFSRQVASFVDELSDDKDALRMAYLLAKVRECLWSTFSERRKYIDKERAERLADSHKDILTRYGSATDPNTIGPDDDMQMAGWLVIMEVDRLVQMCRQHLREPED